MANRLDSTSLFLAQVNQHAEVLQGLLSGVAEDEIDGGRISRCIISTSMLAQSASLMDLSEWQHALNEFAKLLKIYEAQSLPWDERIAQVTSEFIEKEDLLVASACDGGESGLSGAVSAEELRALCREMNELLEYTPEPHGPENETPAEGADAAPEQPVSGTPDREAVRPDAPAESTPDSGSPSAPANGMEEKKSRRRLVPIERGLEASMAELQRHTGGLVELWERSDPVTGGASPLLNDLRTRLFVIGFHALAMERIIESRAGGLPAPMIDTLAPLRAALQDYARAVSRGTDRRIDFTFSGEGHSIDTRLLHPLYRVLQHMVGDVFLRCGERQLYVEIRAEDHHGALRWSLRDNGDTFVADSRLDGDEYLAFYPGLRETRKVLSESHSLLWVEPDGNLGIRFAFTTPRSNQETAFMVWGEGSDRVAVLSNQLAAVHSVEQVEFAPESHGERIVDGRRQVRVLRLGDLYSEGPVEGDRIAVIGSLERRIGIYVQGDARLETGTWQRNGVSAGGAMGSGVALIGKERIPLVEANGLLEKYIAIVDAISAEDVSGGVDPDVSVSSHTQAKREMDANAPPEVLSTKDEVDVLVVEQSEALRKTLETVLFERGFTTKSVAGPQAAVAFLETGAASVVICDFRVPSMAAKTVVEFLRDREKRIPVLVTTSHRGDSARELAEKLGAAGYIAKPLDADEVAARVSAHGGRPAHSRSRLS